MPNRKILPIIYAGSLTSILPVLLAKSTDSHTLMMWVAIGVATQFLFAFAAMAELKNLTHLRDEQKRRWSGLLLVAPLLFGFFYLKNLRGKIDLVN